jgi:hypothetical protein
VRPTFRAILCSCVPLAFAASLAAQEPPDSLAERVRRAEEAIEMLRAQLAEQAQAKVQSRLRNTVELSGLILVNGFFNSGKTNNSDVPLFADTLAPSDTLGLPNSNVGGTLRQTRIGIAISGAHALGAELSGDLALDFFGGQQPSGGGRTFPLARIRTASLRLDWPHIGLLIGQEVPLVSQQNPVSFASAGYPLFSGSGNLWLWIPQVRLTVETSGRAHFGAQVAALAPMQYKAQGLFLTQPDSAERSRRPSAEGRLYLAWGGDETASEVGVGAHLGWIATDGPALIQSRAVTMDLHLALGAHVTVAGEAFTGQALAGLGGGGIGQDIGAGGAPVRTRGGWIQLDIRPSFAWEFGGSVGMDDPNDEDLPDTGRPTPSGGEDYVGRLKNVTAVGHLIVRPGGGFLCGVEFRRIATTYSRGTLTVNHINAYAGIAF